ncbi:TPA: gp53-like domain-containing protein [Enterobacter roggenkampii]
MALLLLAANNAQSVLAAGISASATTMTLNTGTGALFPAPVSGTSFFKLTLIDAATGQISEIVHVTARTGDTLTIVRAQEGTLARAWSVNDIAANMMTAGTLSYILDNYATIASLGTAAARNVGTGANQIPDMSFFGGSSSSSGYQYFPNGTLLQWGTIGLNSSPSGTTIGVFPIAFPSAGYQIVVTHDNPLDSTLAYGAASIISPTQFRVNACAINTSTFTLNPGYAMTLRWIAIGK